MRAALLALVLLTACSDFPDLDGTIPHDVRDAPFQEFLTVDQLNALEDIPAAEVSDPLNSRLARLRARAAALRGPVFTSGDRARLSGSPG